MTKQELEQLRYLKTEIKVLQHELIEYRGNAPMATDSVTGSSPHFPYGKRIWKITGVDQAKLDRMGRRLQRKIDELMDEMDRLNDYIDTIPDSEMRTIMQLRYRNECTLEEIGEELGYHKTSIQKKLAVFLEDSTNSTNT